MFSKPLFKQSCKANALVWSLVTVATCLMLAIVIIVIGNSEASAIRDAMVDVFQDDYVNAQVDKNAITYYYMTDEALSTFEKNDAEFAELIEAIGETGYASLTQGYDALTASGFEDGEAREILALQLTSQGLTREHIDALIDYYLVNGNDLSNTAISSYLMNAVADGIYEKLVAEEGEATAQTVRGLIAQAISGYLSQSESSASDYATEYIAQLVGEQMSAALAEEGLDYTATEIETEARSAIWDFRGQMLIDPDRDAETLIAELSKSIFEEFPEDVASALTEIRDLDVFGLIVGTVFFKAAGLLLPIVYTIMTANNLIAGQVDSGSMAYVLSTPTKRGKVAFTQICYLVLSLFAMFTLTTITGLCCLAAIAGKTAVTISYSEMILLNVGAFITMFAISGICFLASAWFNRSKQSMTWGGGLSMFFLVTVILGLFGSSAIPGAIRIDAMKYFNYVTIISLFDSLSILGGTLTYLWKFAVLVAIGLVCYTAGVIRFNKKDLPL